MTDLNVQENLKLEAELKNEVKKYRSIKHIIKEE